MLVLAMSGLISSWVMSLSGSSKKGKVQDRITGIGVIDLSAYNFYFNLPTIPAELGFSATSLNAEVPLLIPFNLVRYPC